jgi:tRNA 2-thiouridine synthesizing protein A
MRDVHLIGCRRGTVSAMSETLLDVKGMNCPLPVLRANRALRGMAAGDRLRVLATDRAAVADFQAFCRETGHALLAWSEEMGVFSFVIRRRPDPSLTDSPSVEPGPVAVPLADPAAAGQPKPKDR